MYVSGRLAGGFAKPHSEKVAARICRIPVAPLPHWFHVRNFPRPIAVAQFNRSFDVLCRGFSYLLFARACP